MFIWIFNYIDHAVTYVKAFIATAAFLSFGIVVTGDWLQKGAWTITILVGIGTLLKTDSPYRKGVSNLINWVRNEIKKIFRRS